jgi:hypothetical protein
MSHYFCERCDGKSYVEPITQTAYLKYNNRFCLCLTRFLGYTYLLCNLVVYVETQEKDELLGVLLLKCDIYHLSRQVS